jgi:hypothetical protein
VVHPAFAPGGPLVQHVLDEVPEEADAGLAALGATLLEAPQREVAAALDRLGFRAGEREAVVAAAGGDRLAAALATAAAPSSVAALLRRREPEALAVAAACGARAPVRRWLDDWRHVQLEISGDDLLAAGRSGPAVGEGLRRALDAALDGRAPDRASQLREALEGVA